MPVLNNTEQHRTIMSNCLKFINQVELINFYTGSRSLPFSGTNFPEIGNCWSFLFGNFRSGRE